MLSSVGVKRQFASALGRTVYSVFVQGLEAIGCVYQDNFSSRIIYKGPEFSDQLQQNVTIGYTFAEVTRVDIYALAKSLLIDLELLVTDNKGERLYGDAERLSEENPLGYAIV